MPRPPSLTVALWRLCAAMVCAPYWCVVHSLTFSVVPVDLRIGWASVCAVGWNAIISDQNHAAIQRADLPADCKADKGG